MASEELGEIIKRLGSDDPFELLGALEQLNELLRKEKGDPSPIDILTALRSHHDHEVRRSASWCLGKLAQNKVVADYHLEKIAASFRDDDAETRENSAWTMGELTSLKIGREDMIEPLNRLLDDESPETRGMAAWTLGRYAERLGLGKRSSVELLEQLADDGNLFVRKSAVWALERIALLSVGLHDSNHEEDAEPPPGAGRSDEPKD
jgi:HEAT repeat protein